MDFRSPFSKLDELDLSQWVERGPVSLSVSRMDDRVSQQQLRRLALAQSGTEIQKMVRSVVWPLEGADRFPLHVRDQAEYKDVALGPARNPEGYVIRWYGLWFPHRKAVIEQFNARTMPTDSDIDVRQKFMKDCRLAYDYIEPGYKTTWDELAAWLDEFAPRPHREIDNAENNHHSAVDHEP